MHDSDDDVETIRREMQKVRRDVGEDVNGIIRSAQEIADWRSYLRKYPWVCLGAAAQLIVVSSIWAWLPSFLNRYHGVAPAAAGVRAAVVVLIGAAGSMFWGVVVDRLCTGRPRRKAYLLAGLCLGTLLLLVPTFAATNPGLDHGAQLALIALGGFMMTCTVGPVSAIVIDVTHPGLRATGASVLSLFQNLLGLAAGPLIAGTLSDVLGLATALTVMPMFGVLAAVCCMTASRSYEVEIGLRGSTRAMTADHRAAPAGMSA